MEERSSPPLPREAATDLISATIVVAASTITGEKLWARVAAVFGHIVPTAASFPIALFAAIEHQVFAEGCAARSPEGGLNIVITVGCIFFGAGTAEAQRVGGVIQSTIRWNLDRAAGTFSTALTLPRPIAGRPLAIVLYSWGRLILTAIHECTGIRIEGA